MDINFNELFGAPPAEGEQSLSGGHIQIEPQQQSPLDNETLKEINKARYIIKRYELHRQVTNGAIQQIEKDLGKQDPLLLLLMAIEALDHATGGYDGYYKRIKARADELGLEIGTYKP